MDKDWERIKREVERSSVVFWKICSKRHKIRKFVNGAEILTTLERC